ALFNPYLRTSLSQNPFAFQAIISSVADDAGRKYAQKAKPSVKVSRRGFQSYQCNAPSRDILHGSTNKICRNPGDHFLAFLYGPTKSSAAGFTKSAGATGSPKNPFPASSKSIHP
ncbi:MAG: hypothetical protein K9J79_10900, partial [Desulfobacteraceae bacterium]|nr:hypothetical protein [Desulfobacteraceae bacterium]